MDDNTSPIFGPDLDPEVIVNAYQEGKENTAFHLDCSDRLGEQGNRYVSLCFTGGAAALGYTVYLVENGFGTVTWGVLAVGLHLFIVGAILVSAVMAPSQYYPPANEGHNFLMPNLKWHEILRGEIENTIERTLEIRKANEVRGAALRRLAKAALCAPLTFLAAWGVAAGLAMAIEFLSPAPAEQGAGLASAVGTFAAPASLPRISTVDGGQDANSFSILMQLPVMNGA